MIGLNLAALSYSKRSAKYLSYDNSQNLSFKGGRRSPESVIKALSERAIKRDVVIGIDASEYPPFAYLKMVVGTPKVIEKYFERRLTRLCDDLNSCMTRGEISLSKTGDENSSSISLVTTEPAKDGFQKGLVIRDTGMVSIFEKYVPPIFNA